MFEDIICSTIRRLGSEYSLLRRKKGFTQKEVSEKSGLSVFTVSTFESGRSTGLTMAAYIKLLLAIGCGRMIDRRLFPDKNKE